MKAQELAQHIGVKTYELQAIADTYKLPFLAVGQQFGIDASDLPMWRAAMNQNCRDGDT
jgi:hypothetical protein